MRQPFCSMESQNWSELDQFRTSLFRRCEQSRQPVLHIMPDVLYLFLIPFHVLIVFVDIGDMGVLYGNLLDNAIEAAMAVEQEKRYVHVESKFQEGRLLLSIRTASHPGQVPIDRKQKR